LPFIFFAIDFDTPLSPFRQFQPLIFLHYAADILEARQLLRAIRAVLRENAQRAPRDVEQTSGAAAAMSLTCRRAFFALRERAYARGSAQVQARGG
jgi:hypothetical protein